MQSNCHDVSMITPIGVVVHEREIGATIILLVLVSSPALSLAIPLVSGMFNSIVQLHI